MPPRLLVANRMFRSDLTSEKTRKVSADPPNAGSSTGASGPAPDISAMTPRERFDRLYDRIMKAAVIGDSTEVRRFTPMALGAYQQLDARDIDARYHAAMLHTQVEQWPGALALADTILAESPAHLFGYLIRGEVGRVRKDSDLLARAQRDFLANYKSAIRSNRVEYLEHKPALDEFKTEAEKRER